MSQYGKRLKKHKKPQAQLWFLIMTLILSLGLWTVLQVMGFDFNSETEDTTEASMEEGSARLVSLATPVLQEAKKEEAPVILNDPNMNKNWGLAGTEKAWSISQGSRDVVIAVIDTGIDVQHADLKKNLWTNPGETGKDKNGRDKATNGIDDDGNGFKDDVHGWNFVSNTNDLTDNHGHGTHVSGIAGAEGGNGIGISGVAPKVSIMVLKYYDPKSNGNDNLKNTIKSIQYAVKMKAQIINYSGGGLDFSKEEFEAVKLAQKEGILFVAAAGNERSNSDKKPYFPANYPLDNIISVTAVNPFGRVLSTSNFGENSVHIAAPGEGIYSTLPGNKYGVMTGTSQATAFVTGVAALIKASNSEFDYKQVRNQILGTANQSTELFGKAKTAGILNSYAALAIQPAISASGAVEAVINPTSAFPVPDANTSVAVNRDVADSGYEPSVAAQPLSKQLGNLMEVLNRKPNSVGN